MDVEENITLIDFPQMVSISHSNAQDLFERDLEGIIRSAQPLVAFASFILLGSPFILSRTWGIILPSGQDLCEIHEKC